MKNNSRIVFETRKQKEFIDIVKEKSGLTWKDLARAIKKHEITLRYDLRKTRHFMSYDDFINLCDVAKINPTEYSKHIIEVKDSNWGRVKGGKIGGIKKKIVKSKIIIEKPQLSSKLSELAGILLGDGSISRINYAVEIVLNKVVDEYYINYVENLIYELFKVKAHRIRLKNANAIILRINSKELFNFIVNLGLPISGEEKKIPSWIIGNKEFLATAIRGLFDTDGSIYFSSKNCILNFSVYSKHLREQVYSSLKEFGIPTFIVENKNINATSLWKIKRFMSIVGTSNLKNAVKFIEYIKNKNTVKSKDIHTVSNNYKNIVVPFYYEGS